MRARWGCDTPTATPQMALRCDRCAGLGCAECGNLRFITIHRCPRALLNEDPSVWQFVLAWKWTRRGDMGSGVALPVAGGLLDQTAAFVEACSYFDAAIDEARPKES